MKKERIVNIKYLNAENIKPLVRIKKSLSSNGLIKIVSMRNSSTNCRYEKVDPIKESKLISEELGCLKNI